MAVKNKVISGDFNGKDIITAFGTLQISVSWKEAREISKNTVDSYEVLDQDSKKSAVSAVGRAFVGSFLLGPAGLLAGVTAKKKGVHLVAVEFKDGKRSLLQLNDKGYKILLKQLF